MNLIVVGASHRSAQVDLLEKLARVSGPGALRALLAGPHVAEAVLVSTCNRVEVYAAVPAFHAGLAQVGEVLAQQAGVSAEQLASALYVHHGVDAVRHVFRVAAGLDSMVAGESQILGQVRDAYQLAGEVDAAGRVLHELMQQALRVGKRAHAETGIDQAPRSMVSAALDLAEAAAGRALVVGAGAMGSLAISELTRRGFTEVTVANRDISKAERLAESYGVAAASTEDLGVLLTDADLVISVTASAEPVLRLRHFEGRVRPVTILDLALPRDVESGVGELPAVTLLDVERLARLQPAEELAEVERIVAAEVEGYALWLRGSEVAPTVAALRARADDVVAGELRRLAQRRPELSEDQRADVAHAVHRIVQRLLHQPTVRVRQLAAEPGGEAYTQLLRDLFELDVTATNVAEIPEVAL